MKRRASSGQETGSIAFHSFCLDRRGGYLTSAGKTIPLRPKTWAVLLYLAERPGALVTREELLDAVWPEVAVTPDTLTKSIGELRVALGDDSKTPRCIETVHRRGFRFIAATRVSGSTEDVPRIELGESRRGDERSETDIFVGREDELAFLSTGFEKACRGERQTIFITGPAGVGKTALVDTFLQSLEATAGALPVWIGRGTCVEHHGTGEAYMPVLNALDRLARQADAGRLVELLRRVAPTWLVQMPWLLGDDLQALQRTLQTARTDRMLREFAALVETLSTELTLVLVLEDLHWGDAATVDLLAFLAQRDEQARLLLLGTYRPAEAVAHQHPVAQAVRTLQVRRQCVGVPLHELNLQEVERYLEERFPGAEFAPTLAQVVHEYTDGNPLVVIAVIENMLSRGWILETEPGWALTTPVEKLQLEMPDDARRMIEMQLDRLNPEDRRLLQVASVVGKEFPVQPVAAVLQCSVEDAETRCHALARGHSFLCSAGRSEWPDGGGVQRYAFTHELYCRAAYAEIPETRRQRLHRAIGEAVEVAYGERATELAPELAVHFERGRVYARAVVYLVAAAERARQRFAKREAAGYLEAGLELTTLLPNGPDNELRELDVRLALGPILGDLHGFGSEHVLVNYERARAICTEVGEPQRLFHILYALCHVYAVRSDKVLLPELTNELDRLATGLASPIHRVLADSILVRVAVQAGHLDEACRLAAQRLPAPADEKIPPLPFLYGPDPLIGAQCNYAYALWLRGYTERSKAAMRANLAAAQSFGSASRLIPASWFSGLLQACEGNPAAAVEPADRAVALATEYGFEYWRALAIAVRGWVTVQLGQIPQGIDELERARAAHSETDSNLFATYIFAFLAEAHRRAGNVNAGLDSADKGLAVAESTLDRSFWPELWRIKAELLLARSATLRDADSEAAEQCLRRAVEIARQSAARSLELRAATSLARVWRAQQRTKDARTLLSDLCGWFDAGARNSDLTQARALLAELSTTAPVRRRGSAPHRRIGRSRR